MSMHGYTFVRLLFIGLVVYLSILIRPIGSLTWVNGGLGLAVALALVVAEMRLRGAAVTTLLGGLLGFGLGLWIAKAINSGLFWADSADSKVRFLHGLI